MATSLTEPPGSTLTPPQRLRDRGKLSRFFAKVKEKTGEAHIQIDVANINSIDRVEHYHSLPNGVDGEAVIADVAQKIGTAVDTVRKIIKIFR